MEKSGLAMRHYAKTTQPFFKSYCELHLTLWVEEAAILYYMFCIKVCIFPILISIQVLLKAFNSLFAPKLLFIEVFGVSVQLYLDLDLWSFFLDVRIKAIFLLRNHRNAGNAHCQNCLSGKDIMLKTTQHSSFTSSYELHLTLWRIFSSQPENFLSYLSQVTCASVQINVNRSL